MYVPYSLPEFPSHIQLQLPRVVICLVASAIPSHCCHLPLIFPDNNKPLAPVTCFQGMPPGTSIGLMGMTQIIKGSDSSEYNFGGEY